MKTNHLHSRGGTPFDEEFDVIVVGYGFAGGVAAIEASDAGARVLLLEKMPDPGGISICAGGGLRIAKNFEDEVPSVFRLPRVWH